METVSESSCFDGVQGVYTHSSNCCDCKMTFGLFLPKESRSGSVPVLWYLSGLTCTHENAMTKAGAQAHAAKHGIAIAFPDTSPRGIKIPDSADYDLGKGAGFYVNAVREPWSHNYRMLDYIVHELRTLVSGEFPVSDELHGVTGHSMGGHGALTLAMNFPERFRSLSAFSPIANPTKSDWGRKQFGEYFGQAESIWEQHDATMLMYQHGYPGHILVDQGSSDQFLGLLRPESLRSAMKERGQQNTFNLRSGYDHSYFFVATFMETHIAFHAKQLLGER